jgi:hypothetical protein
MPRTALRVDRRLVERVPQCEGLSLSVDLSLLALPGTVSGQVVPDGKYPAFETRPAVT